MIRNERLNESMFRIDENSVDSNKFYTILLDAKAAAISENMCDITEKLLNREKENAKIALDHLWDLKKNLFMEKNGTIDLLINFYQDKMDVLRSKEEHIKNVSRDSRSLLEEKRKRNEEIASVKQQVQECTREINELSAKLEKLKVREQELQLIEMQLAKELNTNENEIVNSLYEIILPHQDLNKPEPIQTPPVKSSKSLFVEPVIEQNEIVSVNNNIQVEKQATEVVPVEPSPVTIDETNIVPAIPRSVYDIAQEQPPFPKSVVKTTRGRIIGEYYYDSTVYKNERHYIFNSRFFCDRLRENLKLIKQRYEQTVFAEMLQMIEDAPKRIAENNKLHFEVSTNEIVNEKTLKQLRLDTKARSLDEVEKFCNRLKAKIEALGSNYRSMLQEQMQRCTGKN